MRPSSVVNILRARELDERRDQSLLDAEGRELAQLFEKCRALLDHLPDENERLLRLLADEFSESGTAEVERVRFFVGAGVGRVARVGAESFPTEGLALARQRGDERSSGLHPTSENDSPAQDDEHSVRVGATLIDDESGRPGRLGGVCGYGIRYIARQSLVPALSLQHPATVIARVRQTNV